MASQLLSITVSRYIATMHSIAIGSRCTVAQLKTNVDDHDCHNCPSYFTVFSVEHDTTKKSTVRSRKTREKNKAAQSTITDIKNSEHPQSVEFPPTPCSIDLEHTIIKDACRRMDPVKANLNQKQMSQEFILKK